MHMHMHRTIIFILGLIVLWTTGIHITAQESVCSVPPRLTVGEDARLLESFDQPSRIRDLPSLDGTFLENLYPGEIVTITDGPVCADGYHWWEIQRVADDTPIGWTVEGIGTEYWLEPTNTGGYYLAYMTKDSSPDNAMNHLYVREMHTGEERLLWSGNADNYHGFMWMPDGERILIGGSPMTFIDVATGDATELWVDSNKFVLSPTGDWIYYTNQRGRLWRIRTDGTNAEQIFRADTGEEIVTYDMAISPDGASLLIHSSEGDPAPRSTDPYRRITAIVDVDGSHFRLVPRETDDYDHNLDWSPDGSQIVISRDAGMSGSLRTFYIVFFEVGAELLPVGEYRGFGSDWSHDTEQITYICPHEDAYSICRMNPETRDSEALMPATRRLWSPVTSPDGRYIAYKGTTGERYRPSEIWVLDTQDNSRTPQRITSRLVISNYTPDEYWYAWSPNSRAPISEITIPTPTAEPSMTPTDLPVTARPTQTSDLVETTPIPDCTLTWEIGTSQRGCPTEAAIEVSASFQAFEGGFMIWRADTGLIWAFDTSEATYSGRSYVDNWDGMPITFTESPPDGRIQPDRGFGSVWVENDDLRQALGWATLPEAAFTMSVQEGINEQGETVVRFNRADAQWFEVPYVETDDGRIFSEWRNSD